MTTNWTAVIITVGIITASYPAGMWCLKQLQEKHPDLYSTLFSVLLFLLFLMLNILIWTD